MAHEDPNRRTFISSLVGGGLALPLLDTDILSARQSSSAQVNRPLVVTSKTNTYVREAVTNTAWEVMAAGGSAMDAAEKGTNISELDPRDRTVGYGGDPNEDGFLQLDASVMNGADGNNIGAVAALENIKTPCSVARLVMDRTDHWLLVGKGALRFARMHGFKEEDLLTDEARRNWLFWKETLSDRDYYFPPRDPDKPEGGGTINVLTLDAGGDIAGVTSTVGHHFKIVGRVGDSPIIGAGLYVDNDIGAAGATGHGEECVKVSASRIVVEKMSEGLAPTVACRHVCERVAARHDGRPMFGLKLVALNKNGEYGCCALRGGLDENGAVTGLGFCIQDSGGHRLEAGEALLPPMTQEELDAIPWR
ncbi:MAG: N(4)-(beta-N-acetylglucosaminyl)-L-asparaginase [bacterium]